MGSVSTNVGAPSILVIAKFQPRSHSWTVHLDRRLTIMRLFLIIALLDGGTGLDAILVYTCPMHLYTFFALSDFIRGPVHQPRLLPRCYQDRTNHAHLQFGLTVPILCQKGTETIDLIEITGTNRTNLTLRK